MFLLRRMDKYTYKQINVHICVYTCIHVCIHVYMCVYTYIYIYIYTCVCVYIYICIRIHIEPVRARDLDPLDAVEEAGQRARDLGCDNNSNY